MIKQACLESSPAWSLGLDVNVPHSANALTEMVHQDSSGIVPGYRDSLLLTFSTAMRICICTILYQARLPFTTGRGGGLPVHSAGAHWKDCFFCPALGTDHSKITLVGQDATLDQGSSPLTLP